MKTAQHSENQKADFLTSDFDFILPPELIAQKPLAFREQARLLSVASYQLTDQHVYDLPALLTEGDLLVMNDTKVIPARLYGKRGDVTIELLLHKKEDPKSWLAFARPGKRLRVGDKIIFGKDFSAEVLEKCPDGLIKVCFSASPKDLLLFLARYGEPPLPPYIKRKEGEAKQDALSYQTVYAEHEGAVAAPTAGLHFTPELLEALAFKNIKHTKLTLHVGAGTFLPVKAHHIKDHVMHAEWGQITVSVAEEINQARREGRRIVAIGTTSLRLLETAADPSGVIKPFMGDTSIFIYPGYHFKVVDLLMTNFHLPKSTLFMLVSAFAGRDVMQKAYDHAIAQKYRFYSYGDASLLSRSTK